MAKIDKLYESGNVSVLLISAFYKEDHTATDFNPLPSISFPIQGGFKYGSGRYNRFTDTNVFLMEQGGIEFTVTKFADFKSDRTICFQFKGGDFGSIHKILGNEKSAESFKRNAQIELLVREFLSASRNGENLQKDQIIDELLVENIFTQKLPAFQISRIAPWHSRKIKTARDYIFSHSSEDISLDDISGACHISAFHFSRLFRKMTGYTPYSYLLQVRIAQAKQLLREGSNVTSTAFESGFNSVANFSYRFKEIVGISPSGYKKSKDSKMY